ncbi:holin [Acidovorax phage AP1]|nr:holin [Acidovorax phage AP1]
MQSMNVETIEQIASFGNRTTLVGGTAGVIGAFIASNLVGLLGVLVALIGVWVNIHFKRAARKLREEIAELQKEEIRTRIKVMVATGTPIIPVPVDVAKEVSTDFGALESAK